jgi:ketosteroid isomerase-like protein
MSDNLGTVQDIYEAFGRGDIPTILGHLHDDVVWEADGVDHGVPWLTPGVGRDHVARFFESLGLVDIGRFEVANLLEGGSQVAAVIRIELTPKATGRTILDLELHLWTFGADGKVVQFKHLVDTHQHVLAAGD